MRDRVNTFYSVTYRDWGRAVAAECFHCGVGNPVGVCYRCNALVCSTESTRPKQFQCTTCGSASAAAGAIAHSNQATLNRLSMALLRSALLPRESAEDLAWLTVEVLIASGLRLRRSDQQVGWQTPDQIRNTVEEFSDEIERAINSVDQNYRAMIMRDRVHPAVMDEAGTESAEDAISQADTLWQRLDSTSKGTFALALLMLLESRPSSWPLVLTVVLYSLHPRPRDLPTHPWG